MSEQKKTQKTWRSFEPVDPDRLREEVKKALPAIIENTGLNRTEISAQIFGCGSRLGKVLNGGQMTEPVVVRLIDHIDALWAQKKS